MDSFSVPAGPDNNVFLTGGLQCCAHPSLLDDCGICNGGNKSCKKKIITAVDAGSDGLGAFNAIMFDSLGGMGSTLSNVDPATGVETMITVGTSTASRRRLCTDSQVSAALLGLPALASYLDSSLFF